MGRSVLLVRGNDGINPRLINPLLRAFVLGYLSTTVPKLVSCLRQLKNKHLSWQQKARELVRVLTNAFRFDSFPTFCATLVGGSTLLPILCYRLYGLLIAKFRPGGDPLASSDSRRFLRFLSAFLSAWFSFQLLNRKPIHVQEYYRRLAKGYADSPDAPTQPRNGLQGQNVPEFAGRTLDLTLFTVTRAVDVVACVAWARWRRWRKAQNRWTLAEVYAPKLADAGLFAASAAVVMWAWFYLPERLPKSYGKWIGDVAKVDWRLIEALRRARRGTFVYGKDTGQAPLLQSMCEDYNWPLEWGDPAQTIPMPCEMVHMGCGPSCEKHAALRFAKTFRFACATYIPLQVAFRLRTSRSMPVLIKAGSDAIRSSTFLAAFVSLFYYSVCLARTRLGPKIFDRKAVTPIMWDSGLCVGAGCLMCGWSILVESTRKRQEIALFVAPRAAATVLPRLYERKYQYRERAAFAVCAAILFTCLQERPKLVRGVFGKIAAKVLECK